MIPELNAYVSGGYFIARLTEAGVERPLSRLLPRRYVSASRCLCDFFIDSWVWNYAGPMDASGNFLNGISGFEERLAAASRFGITAEQLPAVIRWGQLRCGHDFGCPSGFYRLMDARRASDWIGLPPEAYVIFGIGLHRSLAPQFLRDTSEHPHCTVPECVRGGHDLDAEGNALGHELLSTEGGHPAHSWICGGMEASFAELNQVALNPHGYIEDFRAAQEFTGRINCGEIAAEPGRWFPWLIVSYP